jgi:chromosome segregation ATPase
MQESPGVLAVDPQGTMRLLLFLQGLGALMQTILPILTLGACVLAGIFWVQARTAAGKLASLRTRAEAAESERDELKDTTTQRAGKEKARVTEIDDLREKSKDLRRRLAEAQEQAKKVKDAERALREVEEQAHSQVAQARADATAANHELRALREEMSLSRSKRPLPRVEPKPETPAPLPPPVDARPAPLVEAEGRLLVERAHVTEALGRVAIEHQRAQDALREVERLKAKISASDRVYLVQKGELELWKDRFRTLETRTNGLLREADALRRGVVALEKRLPKSKVEEARAEAEAAAASLSSAIGPADPPATPPAEDSPRPLPET